MAFSGVRRSWATNAKYSSRRLLDFERLLGGERPHGRPDRSIQDTVEDMERPPLHAQAVPVGQVVDAAAQDVVLGNDLFDVECVFDPLQAVGGRTAVEKGLSDRLARPGSQGACKLRQEMRDVIVERRHVEIPRRGERPDLRPPQREQGVPLVLDKPCKFVKDVDRHLLFASGVG